MGVSIGSDGEVEKKEAQISQEIRFFIVYWEARFAKTLNGAKKADAFYREILRWLRAREDKWADCHAAFFANFANLLKKTDRGKLLDYIIFVCSCSTALMVCIQT